MVRVAIFGGQALNRYGLRAALEPHDDIEVVADEECTRVAAVIEEHRPDVAVVDTVQPCRQACSLARGIAQRWSTIGILIVANELCECTHEVFGAGARGVVLKHVGPRDLANAVRGLAAGYAIMPGDMAQRVCGGSTTGRTPVSDPRLALLSDRERQVLECLAAGRSNAEIAECLRVGPGTVKSHIQHLLNKLDLRDRVHAVVFAYRSGFVRVPAGAMSADGALEPCGPTPRVRSLVEARGTVVGVTARSRTA